MMKEFIIGFIFIIFISACGIKTTNQSTITNQRNKIDNGLYYGYKQGIISRFQFYVNVKDDTSFFQYFHQLGGVIEMQLIDTLYSQKDSSFLGKITTLFYNNNGRLFLISKKDKLKNEFKIIIKKLPLIEKNNGILIIIL